MCILIGQKITVMNAPWSGRKHLLQKNSEKHKKEK